MTLEEFPRYRTLVRRHTGIWLRDGKEVMLSSRLSRQMRQLGFTHYRDYALFLEGLPPEHEAIREFINSITTNKTAFFREPHHFEFLRDTLVPEVERSSPCGAMRSLRIWSAACSTGEEPYSVAISSLESIGDSIGRWTVDILASDIDTTVLETAREGVYEEASLGSMEPALVHRYFLRGNGANAGRVRVKEKIANRVAVKRINLMDSLWPIEGRFDAIFFRNALIYFQRDIQEHFLRRMLKYLRPDGYLFLGHSEHVPWLYDEVVPLRGTVYRRRAAVRSESARGRVSTPRPPLVARVPLLR